MCVDPAKIQPISVDWNPQNLTEGFRFFHLGIVVDEVVYDCSTWVDEHPGGDSVIRSFGGQDCSWQFWRFHNNKDMANYGLALRIGRTQGVENRYPEPKRYSRLRGFDAEDW